MRWRAFYLRDLVRQWSSASYWTMSRRARECRRARIRQRYESVVLSGEALDRAVEILKRHAA